MIKPEKIEKIKEKMDSYMEFYKSVKTNLEKINDKIMDFDKKVYNKRFKKFLENNHSDDVYIWLKPDNWIEIHSEKNPRMRYDISPIDCTYTPDDATLARVDGKKAKKIISGYIEELEKMIKQMTEEKNNIEKITNKIDASYKRLEKQGKELNYTTKGIIRSEAHFYLIYGDFTTDYSY